MSRLIKKPIPVPEGSTITINGRDILVKGPKGEFALTILPFLTVSQGDDGLKVESKAVTKQARANSGTMWSLLRNAIEGTRNGYTKVLEIQGVGFRAAMEGTTLVLSLGYVHPVRFETPEGTTIAVEKNLITVSGIGKEAVGQAAALIRKFKKPEPYKGKGIRYQGEVVRLKPGKKAASGGK